MHIEWSSAVKWLASTVCSGCVATMLNISALNAAHARDNRQAAAFAAIRIATSLESYASSCAQIVDDYDMSDPSVRRSLAERLPSLHESAEISGFDRLAPSQQDAVLTFRSRMRAADAYVKSAIRYADHLTAVEATRDEAALLGASAWKISSGLRATYGYMP